MPTGRRTATVLFIDVVGSTAVATELGDARFRELLARFNRIVRAALRGAGGHEEDRAGDGFFATFREPARAIACACALTEAVRALGVEIRAGVHTGETERVDGKTQGIAVVIGARVMSLGGPGQVLVTSTTKELATGSGFSFDDVGGHQLKGVHGTWQVWAVTSIDAQPLSPPLPVSEAARRRDDIRSEPPRRRRLPVVVAGLALVVAVVVGAVLLRPSSRPQVADRVGPPEPGTLLQIDPEGGRILSTISIRPLQERRTNRHTAHPLVVGQGGVWLVRRDQLIQIDPHDEEEGERARTGRGNPISINIASGSDAIWLMADWELFRVHPTTVGVTSVAELTPGPIGSTFTTDVVAGGGAVWAGRSDGALLRFLPGKSRSSETTLTTSIDALGAGLGRVWALDAFDETLTEIDPESADPVGNVSIPDGVDALAIGERTVWVLSRSTGQVTPVVEGVAADPIRVGDEPTSIAAGAGAVWVGHEDGTIWRIDEVTRLIDRDRTIPVGTAIRAIAFDPDAETLWVDVW